QWPHLDRLWAHSNIDLVCFDNYMPLSDWTTGDGSLRASGQSNNLDVANWSAPAAVDSAFDYELVTQSIVSTADYGAVSLAVSSSLDYGIVSAAASWPPSPPPALPNFNGLGLAGQPRSTPSLTLKPTSRVAKSSTGSISTRTISGEGRTRSAPICRFHFRKVIT